jgi:hypothetical protein
MALKGHLANSMRVFKYDDVFGHYSLVPDESGAFPPRRRRLLFLLIVITSFSAGVLVTTLLQSLSFSRSLSPPLAHQEVPAFSSVTRQFSYNRTFGADPLEDSSTEDAWDSIVPRELFLQAWRSFGLSASSKLSLTVMALLAAYLVGQGTVRLGKESTEYYTISVMHQLHCLVGVLSSEAFIQGSLAPYSYAPYVHQACNRISSFADIAHPRALFQWAIHQGFYTAVHAEPAAVTDDLQREFPHVRHCFDYIRQALMCSADATLEPVNADLGGVTGWDGTHVCRDFGSLAQWAEDHRTNNLRGFRHKTHHGNHG